jgi:hypothetical protein
MGRFLVAVDEALVVKMVLRDTKKFVAKAGCNVGHIYTGRSSVELRDHWITVENDGVFSSEWGTLISRIPGVTIISLEEHKGHYDWSADTYIRPISIINFKVEKAI